MAFSDRLRQVEGFEVPKIVEELPFTEYITDELSKKISAIPVWNDYPYEKQFELILNFLDSKLNSQFEDLVLSEPEKKAIAEEFLRTNNGFGILDKLLAEESVSAVFVNSLGAVQACVNGEFRRTELVLSQKQYSEISARFESNSAVVREKVNNLFVTLIKPPVSDNVLIIRKISDVSEDLADISSKGLISQDLARFFKYLLNSKKNIIVSGNSAGFVNDFLLVLLNSISDESRAALVEDCGVFAGLMENVTDFSVETLEDFDYEYLLSSVDDLAFDYQFSRLGDYQKFLSYYMRTDLTKQGIITGIDAHSINDAVAKFVNAGAMMLKVTDKQAKAKLASTYDYVVHVEKYKNEGYRVMSVMELVPSKTSALVMNEVATFLDGHYVLDLSEELHSEMERTPFLKEPRKVSFRSRLTEV